MRLYNKERLTLHNGKPAVIEGNKVYYLILKQTGEYKDSYQWVLVDGGKLNE